MTDSEMITDTAAPISDEADTRFVTFLTELREKTGIGAKPMISEIPDAIASALTAALARAERAEKALEWYADLQNYYSTGYGVPVLKDEGRRARAIVEG